jgi:hypothetical protein
VLDKVEESRGEWESGVSVLDVSKIPSEPEMMMTGEDVQGAGDIF